jgi:FkbM family methyltransferase
MTLTSYAQNFEDVILWRALKHVQQGFYIDIGAQDPIIDSVSLAFYEHGWRGVHIEPIPLYAERLRRARTDEEVIQTAVGRGQGDILFFDVAGTGLSTGDESIASWHEAQGHVVKRVSVPCRPLAEILDQYQKREIHWLKIDVEGMEDQVIESWSPARARAWIVVVESTKPNSAETTFARWEPSLVALGYEFVYFDGLNRFYVSIEHPELKAHFGAGPNYFDDFILSGTSLFCNKLNMEIAALHKQLEDSRALMTRSDTWAKTLEGDILAKTEAFASREAELARTSETLKESKDRIKSLNADLTAKNGELASREAELARTSETLKESKDRIKSLNEDLTAKKGALASREAELARTSETLKESKDRIKSLNADLAAKKEALASREAELTRTSETLKERKDRIKSLNADLTAKKEALASREAQLARTNETLKARNNRAKSLEADLIAKTEALASREAELARTSEALNASNNWAKSLETDLIGKNEALTTLYDSRSWRITAPLRAATRVVRWFAHGTWASLTLRPGSRSRRIVRRSVSMAARSCRRSASLTRLARRVLRSFPTLEARVKRIVVSQSLRIEAAPTSRNDDVLFCEPFDVRLAYRRLCAARDNLRRTLPAAALNDAGPRLAFVSPLPPDQTGVADYGAELLTALGAYYNVDAIVTDPERAVANPGCRAIRDVAWFERYAHSYDRIIYQIGNSPFHHHMFPLLEKFPGVVVLHDFYLGNLLAFLETNGGWHGYWTRALCDAHGYEALRRRVGNNTSWDKYLEVIRDYPANLFILQQAQGIIVHNEFSRALTHRFYGNVFSDKVVTIPLTRRLPEKVDRHVARASLGLSDDEFLVCTFGFLGEAKLNHRLLEAWLASRLEEKEYCHLVFVGEALSNAYCDKLQSAIKQSLGNKNIRITGYVPSQLYVQYLAAADVAVQLRCDSRGESSGTVLDCMAYGLPLIVNAHGWMAELPDEGVIKLANAFVDADLVAAIERLEADPALRAALGEQARNVTRVSSPALVADRYHKVIEGFTKCAAPLFDIKALSGIAADLALVSEDEVHWLEKARSLAEATPLKRSERQLLIDVSAMVRVDLRTGIQRAVRAQLMGLLNNPPDGFRIEPVWLCEAKGRWHLRYARRYAAGLLGIGGEDLEDEPVAVAKDDIYYMPDYFNDGVESAAQAGVYARLRDSGVRINFMIYDHLPISKPQFFPKESDIIHEKWLRSISGNADQLICISQHVADETTRWLEKNCPTLHPKPKINFLHLGADMASSGTNECPENSPIALDALSSRPTFLMVGTIEPRKGYLQALKAFDELWADDVNVNLVIVGAEGWQPVPEHNRRNIPEIVARLRGHPERDRRLFWLEGLSDEHLEKVYATSVCLIAASEGEGFGLPLIEAAKHKLPIIARDIPVFREVAGKYAAYFAGMRPGDLAGAIRNWLALYAEGRHPKSDSMPWITWAENVQRLKALLLSGA